MQAICSISLVHAAFLYRCCVSFQKKNTCPNLSNSQWFAYIQGQLTNHLNALFSMSSDCWHLWDSDPVYHSKSHCGHRQTISRPIRISMQRSFSSTVDGEQSKRFIRRRHLPDITRVATITEHVQLSVRVLKPYMLVRSMDDASLPTIYWSVIIVKLTYAYASSAWWGFTMQLIDSGVEWS